MPQQQVNDTHPLIRAGDEIKRLRTALEFYADEKRWRVIRAVIGGANPHRKSQELAADKGQVARTALAERQ